MAASHTSGRVMGSPFKLVQAGTLFSGLKTLRPPMLLRDTYYGGQGLITGTVKEKGTPTNTPLHRRVVLIDERSRLPIRETWSDAATGNYEFRGVKEGVKYTVLSYDHTGAYRATVADAQIPELVS